MKTPEQRENDMLKAAKNYAQQYEGLIYTIGSIAGVSGIRMAFERGVHFGLHQALDITVEREKAERNAEQHWISVKERLPETNELCIVNTEWRGIVPATYGNESWIFDEGQGWSEKALSYASHWMPLPEPPKE